MCFAFMSVSCTVMCMDVNYCKLIDLLYLCIQLPQARLTVAAGQHKHVVLPVFKNILPVIYVSIPTVIISKWFLDIQTQNRNLFKGNHKKYGNPDCSTSCTKRTLTSGMWQTSQNFIFFYLDTCTCMSCNIVSLFECHLWYSVVFKIWITL